MLENFISLLAEIFKRLLSYQDILKNNLIFQLRLIFYTAKILNRFVGFLDQLSSNFDTQKSRDSNDACFS